MFLFCLSCLLLAGGPVSGGAVAGDSIGIYRTRQDYLSHRIDWLSDPKAKINVQPEFAGCPLNVASDDILYLRQAGRHKQRIRPDSVFGFIRQGFEYLYFPQEKRYMAVLNDKPPLMLVLKADVHWHVDWSEVDDTLLYTRGVDKPLSILTRENILKDFGDSGQLASRLLLLSRAIIREQYYADVNSKDFKEYLQMVQDYLYGDFPIRKKHYPRCVL